MAKRPLSLCASITLCVSARIAPSPSAAWLAGFAELTPVAPQYRETMTAGPKALREGEERMLAVRPPFHIYALSVNMILGL